MRDNYGVEEVEGEAGQNIVIRARGNGVSYIAQNGMLSLYLDEVTADSLAFHIQTIIEDRKRRKESQNKALQSK